MAIDMAKWGVGHAEPKSLLTAANDIGWRAVAARVSGLSIAGNAPGPHAGCLPLSLLRGRRRMILFAHDQNRARRVA